MQAQVSVGIVLAAEVLFLPNLHITVNLFSPPAAFASFPLLVSSLLYERH